VRTIAATIILSSISFFSGAQFSSERSLLHPTYGASSIKNIDLDGDGDIDVLSSSQNNDEITIFENNGSAEFSTSSIHIVSTLADGPIQLSTSDLDNDGDLDIVSISTEDNKVAVYENLGNLQFGTQLTISTAITNLKLLELSDLDNDGFADIIVLTDNDLKWFHNNGNLTFGTPINLASLSVSASNGAIHPFNIDNDSDIDILYGFSNFLYKITNQGNGVFDAPVLISNQAYSIRSIYSKDLNNDGNLDFVTADYAGINKFINNGLGSFSAPTVVNAVYNGYQVMAEDMDDDNDLDIIWSEVNSSGFDDFLIKWARNDGSGGYQDLFLVSSAVKGATHFAISDLDLDGDKDVSSSSKSDGKIAYYINIADTTFETQRLLSSSVNSPNSIAAGDMNNDGFQDLLTASADGKISYFKNDTNGSFSIQQVIYNQLDGVQETGSPTLQTGDLDNDGDLDIASFCAYHSYTNGNNPTKTYWLENSGTGTYIYHQLYEPYSQNGIESGKTDLQLADINGDGYLDMILSHYDANRVSIFKNLGNGSFSGSQPIASYTLHPISIAIADLDNDGLNDIIAGTGDLLFYKNLGNFAFDQEQILLTAVGEITALDVSDIDGDSDLDVLIGNSSNYSVSWYENTGSLVFGAENSITTQTNSWINSVHATDIDQDGIKDVLFSAYHTGITAWSKNSGNGTFSSPQIIGDNNFSVYCATAIDIDNDGDQDVADLTYIAHDIFWFENNVYDQSNSGGTVFADLNLNGILDSADFGIHDALVFSNPESDFTYSFSNGDYLIRLSDTIGDYTIEAAAIPHWELTTDSLLYHVSIDSNVTAFEHLNFGFAPIEVIDEIHPSLTGGFPRCNTVINYWIDVKNTGTTIPSGIIQLELDPQVEFISASVTPDSIVNQHIYWHYDSLMYFSNNQFNLNVQLPDFNSSGDSLNSFLTALILDPNSGNIIQSFQDTLSQILVCAYDPNDKTVSPAGIDIPGYVSIDQEWLEYTIRFQNTGNDTAVNVTIKDQLDSNLNWLSLTPIAYSHPVAITGNQNGEITFDFHAIHLPDSGVNELNSHGFIRYRIKLKEQLQAGTQIRNTANIYFDYNPEITTNTTLNTLYECPTTTSIQLTSATTVCKGEVVSMNVQNELSNSTIIWDLDQVEHQESTVFSWTSDTAGNFNLQLVVTNDFCSRDTSLQITVNDLPVVQLSDFQTDTLCLQSAAISLPLGTPQGGIYSGNGVSGQQFDPNLTQAGPNTVYYSYTLNGCTSTDSALITIENCLAIAELENSDISIYPNPFSDFTTLQFEKEPNGNYNLSIYNVLGEIVSVKKAFSGNTQIIERGEISTGVYLLVIIDQETGKTSQKRVVIE
jgi:uncharacterized repeat protein (TIGR01451 family)